MRELPLNALRALAAVHSQGGLRAAAAELGVAHSSVSRHLAELEAWVGVRLRASPSGSRRLILTPQGERLAKAVASGLREIEAAVASLREPKSANAVAIGTVPSFAARWLLPRLPEFERSHPRLEVSVIVEKRLDDLESAGVDLAIQMGEGPWPGSRCEPLADEALYPVMSPDYWRKAGRPAAPAALRGLRLLHDRDPQATWEAWRREHGPKQLDVSHGPRFTSTDLVLRAAAQGQGVALARHRLVVGDLAAGLLLRPLGVLAVRLERAYWVLLPRLVFQRPGTETVIRWLKRQAASQPSPGQSSRRAW
jgi:LysR family glycine cleavage system transcriptional activator